MDLVMLEEHVLLVKIHLDAISLVKEEPPLIFSLDMGSTKVEIMVNWMRIESFICEKLLVENSVYFKFINFFKVSCK